MSVLVTPSGRPFRAERLEVVDADQHERIARSVVDVERAFPSEWMTLLRSESPVSTVHSYLLPYWYAPAARWVLYQGMPESVIRADVERPVCPGMTGEEFLSVVAGKAPRDLPVDDRTPYVSDVQYEFWRRYRVYAAPFWVLQGDTGGHQVTFGPWQQQLLAAQGLPVTPPVVGSLDAAPFDNRVLSQLRALNRLRQMGNSIDRLRASASKDAGDALLSDQLRQIREAELAFLTRQMEPLLDAAASVSRRADSHDHLMYVQPGTAGRAAAALDVYRETGDFIL